MKYLDFFEGFKKEKKEKEFTGKKSTYLYDDIHDEKGSRYGTCKKCGKVVNMVSHEQGKEGDECKEKHIFE